MSVDDKETKKVPVVKKPSPQDVVDVKSKVRGGHKAHITKMLHRVQIFTTDYDEELESELLATLESIERKSQLIQSLDVEILSTLGDDGEIMKEIETSGDFQTKVSAEVTKAKMFLAKRKKIPETSWGAT